MQLGLHVCDFRTEDGPAGIGPVLERLVQRADEAGVHSFWPMDHFFQIPVFGPTEDPMLEAYTLLSWAAAHTTRLEVGTLVTGVHYRHPGALLKAVTSLDVLSGGRAWLGIGAGWNEEESRGLGIPFPTLRDRFSQLEETLQVAHRMFTGDESPYTGSQFQLDRPLNNPAPVRRPPILIGGGGEKKTLRMVAQYGDACNLFEFAGEDVLGHKLSVLQQHCADVGRPYEDIVKTCFGQLGTPEVGQLVDRFGRLGELGFDLVMTDVPDPAGSDLDKLFDVLAEVVRQLEPLGRPLPAAATAVA
ncbi:MAG: TIGR03560 family F420-dependent LLM class oxidoreductase [Streptosporangiales bacterium]|nr:TIGR03560 family F420-dependent LLM class oxidoreductase [Streptosporangiales bacterium]